ncbi:hypothetical protein KL86DPRO_10133 [uncultured delta proteobacterium]|uniref:Uncharacterized protein n=1 Tax=uncultured delta proteobacterium TaxID=34034 RepID=A0A212IVX3_9DELT|nr:hypothetical protein KL86DPRO_10133 [uncultured delta proteobacterium]
MGFKGSKVQILSSRPEIIGAYDYSRKPFFCWGFCPRYSLFTVSDLNYKITPTRKTNNKITAFITSQREDGRAPLPGKRTG